MTGVPEVGDLVVERDSTPGADQSRAWWAGASNAGRNIHHDEEFARRNRLPGLLISAPHLLALASDALHQRFGDSWTAASDVRLEYRDMVVAGDQVRVLATVAERTDGPDTADLRIDVTVVKLVDGQPAPKPACRGSAQLRLPLSG